MAITPGSDVDEKPEPLPRGPVVEQGGQLSRGWFNWFNGKDRMLGEIVSGVNRNRQNIVQLQTDYQAADGSISSAYIAADAVVAADAESARATLSTTLTAAFQAADASLQTQIDNRATITQLNTVESDAASARATLSTTLTAAYQAADTALQTDINTRATITYVDTAVADEASARATLSTTLTAAFEAGDANLQTQVNNRATITYVDTAVADEASARASAISTLEAAYQSADSTITANVSTNATAIASLEGASAIYEIIAAASGGNPARIKLKAGVGGADVELDADRVWFGDETRFDTTSETFITEVGGVRSRYGTAFGASGSQVVMWHGPDSVALGSEARNNGYLSIGTNGSIWHNTAALDWGATASAAAAQTSIGTAAAIAGQGWGATASEANASNAVVPTGANAIRDTGFRQPSGYWSSPTTTGGTVTTTTETQVGDLRVRKISVTGGNATGYLRHSADTTKNALPCRPGDRIAAAALIGGSGLSNAYVSIIFYNASGAYIGEGATSLGVPPAAGTGGEPGFTRHGHFATAPALAAFAKIAARGLTNNATASFSIANPSISIVPADQTALPPFSPGFDAAPGADPTIDNTAAAIAGQGWGATAAEAAASNALVPKGTNLAVNGTFSQGNIGWSRTTGAGSIVTDAANAYIGDKYFLVDATSTQRNANQYVIEVVPGEYLRISGAAKRLAAGSGGDVRARIRYLDAAGGNLGTTQVVWTTEASHTLKSAVGAVPATANRAEIDILVNSPAGGRTWAVGLVFVERLTKSGENLIDSAGNVLGDAAIITASGTAAAITGQGVYATANYYSSETDPAPVPDGSDWYKPSTKELKKRVAGAWQLMGKFTDAALAISRTNGFVKTRIGAGTITSDSVSFSSTGGSGTGYTYAHELFATYTTGPTLTISSASGSPITASAAGAVPGDEIRGFVQTTVTDSAGNKATLLSPVALFCES